jgi:plasmid stabilization system protein ParE
VSLEVQFLSGADADFQAIFNKLEDRREGYGVEFALAVDAYLTRLSSFPESAPVYFENVRRQVMHLVPYGIFYEHHPTRILVAAILDLRQDPEKIRQRFKG